jgi:hypothetical protein
MQAARTMPQTARRALVIAEMLQRAVKFMLPNCVQLVDERSLRESHLQLFRLPYPLVAFEAPWIKEQADNDEIYGFAQSRSTRRIALCWELSDDFEPFPGVNAISQAFPAGGVFVIQRRSVLTAETRSPWPCKRPACSIVRMSILLISPRAAH